MNSERLRVRGVNWLVSAGYSRLFDGGNLPGLLDGTAGRVVRSSRTRKVVRGKAGCGGRKLTLYIKIYDAPAFPLSLLVSRGMREYRALREAERRGVETVRAVAVGERRRGGTIDKNYLLTEEIPGCVPLSGVRLPELELRARRRIIRSVAIALRELHDRGVLHRDLHSGNILMRRGLVDRGGEPAIFIIDLHGAKFRSALSVRARMKNLIQLNTYYGLVTSRSDRMYFLSTYARGREYDLGGIAAAVEKGARRARWRLWRRRAKRYIRRGKYAHAIRGGGYRGFISSRSDTPSMRRLLRDPAGAYGRGSIIKSSRTNRVASLTAEGMGRLAVKWHRPPSLLKKAGSFMRPSRGKKAWRGALGVAERMVGVAEAIAFVDRRRFGLVKDSFFVARYLEGCAVLPHYARDTRPGMSVRDRREFCRELGRFLAGAHHRGVCHTDLKGSNIMVRGGPPARFYLLDPEAIRFKKRLSRAAAVENLSRLERYMRPWSSATDRLETLSVYLSARGEPGLLRSFWGAIARCGERGGRAG